MLNRFPGSEKLGPSRNGRMERNFPVNSDFPEFQANLVRYAQNLGMKFWKMSVPFQPAARTGVIFCVFPGIFDRMESAKCQTSTNSRPIMKILRFLIVNPHRSGYDITTSKHTAKMSCMSTNHVLRHQKGMSIVTRGSEGIMGIATLYLLVTVKKSMSDSLGEYHETFRICNNSLSMADV